MHGSLPVARHCYHKNQKTKVLRATMKVLDREEYIAGSLAMTGCDRLTNGSCLGLGCSQVPVPYKMTSFQVYTKRNTESSVGKWSFNNCTYGFVVKKDHYTFQETDFDNMHKRSFPVVFQWSVGNTSCEEAQKNGTNYVCKENSVCTDALNELNQGYQMGYQ
ncbi:hypothetical protein HanRHA438_Chr01g0018571 [Helianthus annuus]|uniref:Uncharacterized protein n=1 Tax=Helianthus annuus TaxID=4232 RepID=A0A9K3JUN7_HELAN|nr:hypothetical protein HanXRQr2_Chr01g0018121 [Helianthus annuus]KAJ0611353.1 hypothetical protein HanHA300_Chr01g0014541 [Helianthus annuus]KAJ0622377.1 hypothetical protein HanIR_Chr01g0019691 [Helianthus annuus]KAJ0626655.1 hypothetical protein HanHA89_Chr01g0016191 [Helianthus annuus]KAJ0783000.1 hypothetical protein HanLR1_Chr01g0015111 [Helianthus annuus]